jgi:hypothetical protein
MTSKQITPGRSSYILLCGWLMAGMAVADEFYSSYVDSSYPTNVYWGDTHLHTSLSIDAYHGGNRALGPADAYQFARGGVVQSSTGGKVKLRRPLDFLVVADHAYNIGVLPRLAMADPILLETEKGKRLFSLYERLKADTETTEDPIRSKEFWDEVDFGQDEVRDETFRRSVWHTITAYADQYNDPGEFTAFIGYEWTSEYTGPTPTSGWASIYGDKPRGSRHRVVIFKDGADKVNQVLPFSMYDSMNPADLWKVLDRYQQQTGGDALAIPHGANVSDGQMFALVDYDGFPQDQGYAEMRSRWEPLFEVTQIKGDSESHPALSPTDEFADYHIWNSWEGVALLAGRTWDDAERQRKRSEYARSALKLGLQQQAVLGINPFKFGMVGSTDSHTAMSAVEENNYWGSTPRKEPSVKRGTAEMVNARAYSAAGYAAVWAKENTRESLFAAMKRKEVYATTGPRITVRFFGGWDFEPVDALRPDLASIGYQKGVPMGSDLTQAPVGNAPTFLIGAVKDPDGANLDRVQVIKGWLDSNNELHEMIFNVSLSDDRDADKPESVGNTVDVKDASYTNSIGDPELSVVWQDPEFDPHELAFYYVRVLEIPTPHWTAYDAKFFGTDPVYDRGAMVTQERAYTSPIWYTP